MSASVLKEFLVKIGFKIDDQQFRRFDETMRKTSKGALEVMKNFTAATAATVAAGTAIGAALNAAAKPLEGLYFAAQRTGASAKELEVFSLAAQQVGVSAEQAKGSIESLAQARRTNPGLNGLLANLGIDPKQTDNAKVLVQLLARLHSMPHFQGAQIASMFGIDEQTFNQIETNGQQFVKALKDAEVASKNIDYDKMAKDSHEFEERVRTLKLQFEGLADRIATRLFPVAEKLIGWIERAIDRFDKFDDKLRGWPSKIIAIAAAFTTLTTAINLFGKATGIMNLLGGVAKLAGPGIAGGAAAGEGAAAAGAGLLGGIALPAIIAAAAGAAIIWMTTHPDQVRAAARWVGAEAKDLGIKAKDATVIEAKALPSQVSSLIQEALKSAKNLTSNVKNAGGLGNVLQSMPGILGSMARFTASFEGHAKNGYGAYIDIAGHPTAGYGHLIKPGEDFSKGLDQQGALALLQKDLAWASAAVKKLVKVPITENMREALTDFVFGSGEGGFAKSTLLKELNAGHYQAAADQFAHWNKAMVNGHLSVISGLTRRRAAEAQLFRTPDKPDVTLNQKTIIKIIGTNDPDANARAAARQQNRVNGDMVRNLSGNVQ